MKELIAALETAWDADATLNAVANPFAELAPEASTLPRATYHYVPGAPPTHTFGRTRIATTDIQINLFGRPLSTLWDYSRALEDLLDMPATKLATESPVAVMSQRSRHEPFVHPTTTKDPDDNTVYQIVHTYRFETHRDLP